MKVRRVGSLPALTAESVPDVGALWRLFRKRKKFASPSALESVIERLSDPDPEQRRTAEGLLMDLRLNPHDGKTALVLSRCIMGGGPQARACLKKLARMAHCPLKEALLDCVVRSLATHREEALEVLKTYPWEVLLPYLLKEVLLKPGQPKDLKEEVVRLLLEERNSIAAALPPEPTELTELLLEASREETAREAIFGLLEAWLEGRGKKASLLERLGLLKAHLPKQKEAH